MENANRFGIKRFLLLAGHLGERVKETLASASIPQVEVVIEPEPLGPPAPCDLPQITSSRRS